MTLQRSGLEYNCNGKNENLKTLRIFPVVIEDVSINKTTLQIRFIRHLNLCQRSLDYVPKKKNHRNTNDVLAPGVEVSDRNKLKPSKLHRTTSGPPSIEIHEEYFTALISSHVPSKEGEPSSEPASPVKAVKAWHTLTSRLARTFESRLDLLNCPCTPGSRDLWLVMYRLLDIHMVAQV
ncbi:hypothetical protein J6590_090694 [Homalodisca vitripennis]|nr:hypothetical protein J6590_090694 [Homalodisca vitripennis]